MTFMYKNKGDKKDIKSYRKITTLPNYINHFHRILSLRLGLYITENQLFDKTIQKAGMNGCSFGILEQVYKLRSLINDANNNKKSAAIIFIDFTSAFDTIDLNAIYATLNEYKVDPRIVRYIKQFYAKLQFYTSSRGKAGELKKWKSGLVQGCSLSPLLFTLAINYILTHINNTSIDANGYKYSDTDCILLFLAFMDDIVVTCDSLDSLEEVYKELYQALLPFNLKINLSKSAIMLINQPEGRKPQGKLADIPIVDSYKYLGNIITVDGKYDQNYEAVKKDIYRKIASVQYSKVDDKEAKFKTFYPSIKKALMKLYDVEDYDLERIVYMITQNLKNMDIDADQFDLRVKDNMDYIISQSDDKVVHKIPKKLTKSKRKDNSDRPSKSEMLLLKESYSNNQTVESDSEADDEVDNIEK